MTMRFTNAPMSLKSSVIIGEIAFSNADLPLRLYGIFVRGMPSASTFADQLLAYFPSTTPVMLVQQPPSRAVAGVVFRIRVPKSSTTAEREKVLEIAHNVRLALQTEAALDEPGFLLIDGAAMQPGSRVIVQGSQTPASNGVYGVQPGGWRRP